MTPGSFARKIARTSHHSEALQFSQLGKVSGILARMGFFLKSSLINGHSELPGIRTALLDALDTVSFSILRVGAIAKSLQPLFSQAITAEVVIPARMGLETAQLPDSMIISAARTNL
jgi:hypothetical protein